VAVQNRRHAKQNPYAQVKGDYTVDEVMRSPVIASPIKRLDASPVTDGCCAILMMAEDAAERHGLKPAWIRGVGFCTDSYYLGHRDLTAIESAHNAAARAYKMAGVSDPLSEINVAEIHAPFSFQELMMIEALGFCDKGKGGEFVRSGATAAGGALPVNLSGGALAANPIFAAGLIRLAEAADQVTGQAAGVAIGANSSNIAPQAITAVAHATSGFALQSNIVYVLGS
jgi:acetyl-CoA C-acetyltransferase